MNTVSKQGIKLDNQENLYSPDEETLARAILTFCLEGADAIMYALLLGAQKAQLIVEALRAISDDIQKHMLKPKAEQMQFAFTSQCAQNDEESAKNTIDKSIQQSRQEIMKIIKQNDFTKRLEHYFKIGLNAWGNKKANDTQTDIALHKSISIWCMRLIHIPTWDTKHLKSWFTMSSKQWIVAPHSPYWPKQLQDLAIRGQWAPPLCLWGIGNPYALVQCRQPLAIVGSRGCTDYGHDLAYHFAYSCASKGHSIISGGAFGIDAAAHWGALDALSSNIGSTLPIGRTIAVFAGGLNNIGPSSNKILFDSIVENGGALISELCPDTTPIARRFLLRNRIIAALASKVIVTQARARSGALNTATWASDLNRELYAVPGDITSPHNTGCNNIIHEGKAIMIRSKYDIEEIFPTSHHYISSTQSNYSPKISKVEREEQSNNQNEAKEDTSNSDKTVTFDCKNSLQEQIITAIRKCRRKKEDATVDTVYSEIVTCYKNTSSNENAPSIAEVSGIITMLELDGIIKRNNENLVITK